MLLGADYLNSFTSVASFQFKNNYEETSTDNLDEDEGVVTLWKKTNLVDKNKSFDKKEEINDEGINSRSFKILHQFNTKK